MSGINNHFDYTNMFKSIAEQHPYIAYFAHGHWERIYNLQDGLIDYPLFWLEFPEVSFFQEGYVGLLFDGGFSILGTAEADDWDGENKVLDDTFTAGTQVIAFLRHICKSNGFEFEYKDSWAQPIAKSTSNNQWGWRFNTKISIPMNTCLSNLDDLNLEWMAPNGDIWRSPNGLDWQRS